MPDVTDTALVAVTELGQLRAEMPSLLRQGHPQSATVLGSLADVASALFTASVEAYSAGNEDALRQVCSRQRSALASTSELIAQTDACLPDRSDAVQEAFAFVGGLLDMVAA